MRDNQAARGDSALGAWFAERHVYLRSGAESRYLVLSRSLQIGVTLAVVLVLAGLAVAGYSVLGGHIERVEQRREIARLASLVQSLRSAGAILMRDLGMRASKPATDESDDLFETANLSPTLTGLPMVVWISERGRARYDARVKVSLAHGRRARPDRTASVSVRPAVELVAGRELAGGTWSSYANGSR